MKKIIDILITILLITPSIWIVIGAIIIYFMIKGGVVKI